MFDLTCSIVLYHNPSNEVRIAIESFLNANRHVKLFLVDNSKDDLLRFQFISPQIEYIFNGRNLGYGKGHNIAIKRAINESKYHLVLNPDVEFNPAILDSLYEFMEANREVGLVMPKVYYKNGHLQYLCKKLPSPADLILRRFIPKSVQSIFKNSMDQYELKHKDYNRIMEVPNLSGCFMFIRTSVLKVVGDFDERFFLYLEDTDLCRRIGQQFKTVYYPNASIIHGYSKASYKSFSLMKMHLASSIKYFNKWGWLFDFERAAINNRVLNSVFKPKTAAKTYEDKIQIPAANYTEILTPSL